jgi:hypothetical protein
VLVLHRHDGGTESSRRRLDTRDVVMGGKDRANSRLCIGDARQALQVAEASREQSENQEQDYERDPQQTIV